MNRAVVVLILACSLLGARLAAAPPNKVHRIGFLWHASSALTHNLLAAFREGLHERGYVEGTHFVLEHRYAEGRPERLPVLAAELVGLNVAVIVTSGTVAIQAVQQATRTIPVVMAASGEPVASGFVTSLAQPGGNLTGLCLFAPELSGKRLELLKEAVPEITRVAVLANPSNPLTAPQRQETERAAQALRVQLQYVAVREVAEIDGAFVAMTRGDADALIVLLELLFMTLRTRLVGLTLERRLPAVFGFREDAEAGALLAYGPNFPGLFRRAATYVDKLLNGAKPGNLPVEQPTKFELVLNLNTAKALGLTMPLTLLLQADEVIR